MLLNLLLRDLTLHRRVLVSSLFIPVLLLVALAMTPENRNDGFGPHLIFGLFLFALLPLSLHIREGSLGTMADLLVLPLHRRELVRLRFLEGTLACLGYFVLFLIWWVLKLHPDRKAILELFRVPLLPWVLVVGLAYPLPFALKWGGKGLAVAYLALMAGFLGFALLMVFGPQMPALGWLFRGLKALEGFHLGGGPGVAQALAFAVPLLLLAAGYRISVWTLQRVEG